MHVRVAAKRPVHQCKAHGLRAHGTLTGQLRQRRRHPGWRLTTKASQGSALLAACEPQFIDWRLNNSAKVQAPPGAPPIVILPGFGNDSGDYE